MATVRGDGMEAQGRMLVRRFTEDLVATTELENATKRAQVREDNENQVVEQVRVQTVYDDLSDESNPDFSSVEVARKAFNQISEEFAAEIQTAQTKRWSLRKSSKTKANEQLQNAKVRDFGDLRQLVDDLDEKWRTSNGPVYNHFQRLCKTLDDHKAVFKLFPSQNTYAATLCGGLSLIVQASVNHDSVPEFLSKAIAAISEEAALCAELVDIVRERRLQARLSDIYARLFRFYRDVMAWYLNSRSAKFISSFNERLKDLYKDALDELQDRIKKLYHEGSNIEHSKINLLVKDVAGIKYELSRQRQSWYTDSAVGKQGLNMLRDTVRDTLRVTLRGIYAELELQEQRVHRLERGTRITGVEEQILLGNGPSVATRSISGKILREKIQTVQRVIVGDEGQRFFEHGRFWLADEMTVSMLAEWMGNKISQTLWISTPQGFIPGESVTGARAAALSAIATAWEAKHPIISHFCARPHPKDIPDDMSIEEAGLIGLVYSLINQLQQTIPDEKPSGISEAEVEALDGSRTSWSTSLSVLKALLHRTPKLSYCVIDGLNELEWDNGTEWCEQFLGLLRDHQQEQTFNVLLTTTGQSRLLAEKISVERRYMALGRARAVRLVKEEAA